MESTFVRKRDQGNFLLLIFPVEQMIDCFDGGNYLQAE